VARQPKGDHPADDERRLLLLDHLLVELRDSPPVTWACARWDRRLGLKAAEDIFVNLERHAPDFAPADYAGRLRRAAAVWSRPAFQRGVVRTLRRFGFPEVVAHDLAPLMFYLCLDWAGCHVPPERPWPEGPEGLPPPPFSVAPRAVRGGRRGPRRELVWLSPSRRAKRKPNSDDPPYALWAHWYYRIDICGESQTAVAKYFGPQFGRQFRPQGVHEHTENCGCKLAIRRALKQTRRVLDI
jgi:hypothetical protein